jgi:hypothetical protein
MLLLSQNLRWTLSLVLILLNHVAYLHLHLLVALGVGCTNWFIHKHSGVRVKPLKIYNFLDLDFVRPNLIWFDETLLLANRERHFLERVIIALLLELVGKRIRGSVLTHFVELLVR